MTDDFLTRFEQRRQERLAADRSFPLAGETLIHKASVAPEVGKRLEDMRQEVGRELDEAKRRLAEANGEPLDLSDLKISDDIMIQAADETIIACLEPDSHETWARLRAIDAEYPLNFEEIMMLADYLLGRVTGIPTDAPAGSSAGREKTGRKSKADSSSTAKASTG